MLKDSFTNRMLIKASILSLRSIAPLCSLYTILRGIGWIYKKGPFSQLPGPWISILPLDIYALSETAFFWLSFLPRRYWINRPAPSYLPFTTSPDRRRTFVKTWDSTPDPKRYVELYFHGTPLESLSKDNIREWLVWRFWGKRDSGSGESSVLLPDVAGPELEEYVAYTERVLRHKFVEGQSERTSMAVMLEPVRMVHRPLLWYVLIVGSVDVMACAAMLRLGFRFYRSSACSFAMSFPPRPMTLLGRAQSPTSRFSYWLRPHTSDNPDHLPILFVHGIGVGLHFYLPFLRSLASENTIGILSLELLPISSRMTSPLPGSAETAAAIHDILRAHKWKECILVSHSYGSVIAAHLLRYRPTAGMVRDLVFVDPVALSFHPPDVAWNFLRRRPKTASEWQLWYFASTDPDIARALCRRFEWVENSMWRDDLEERLGRSTIFLAGKDIIVDTDSLGEYLTRQCDNHGRRWYSLPMNERRTNEWKEVKWTGHRAIEIVYNEGLNHAEVFEEKEPRTQLVRVVQHYAGIR